MILAAAALSGCTALAGPARVEDSRTGKQAMAFPGLLPDGGGRPSRRYIFQIHGIQTTNDDWINNLFNGITHYGYTRTAGQPVNSRLRTSMVVAGRGLLCTDPGPACIYDHFGTFQKDIFVNPVTKDQVTVFSYRWRDDMWKITGPHP